MLLYIRDIEASVVREYPRPKTVYSKLLNLIVSLLSLWSIVLEHLPFQVPLDCEETKYHVVKEPLKHYLTPVYFAMALFLYCNTQGGLRKTL